MARLLYPCVWTQILLPTVAQIRLIGMVRKERWVFTGQTEKRWPHSADEPMMRSKERPDAVTYQLNKTHEATGARQGGERWVKWPKG